GILQRPAGKDKAHARTSDWTSRLPLLFHGTRHVFRITSTPDGNDSAAHWVLLEDSERDFSGSLARARIGGIARTSSFTHSRHQ
ncbi:MAG TPA: hypothetical protein VFJ20_13810, partial [Gemmatimonadaceae bacterium]|nr:hypothetical protein [Gemmatimonadaceae bacterium]